MNKGFIEKRLKNQLLDGFAQYSKEYGYEIPKSDFTKEDFDASVYFSAKILLSNAYKRPNNEKFYERIEQIFGRILDKTSADKYIYINFLDKCSAKFNTQIQDGVDSWGIYVIKDENFIMDFHYIPQLIEYESEYPQIASVEDTMRIEDDIVKIYRWKELLARDDDHSLKKNRDVIKNLLIHRNNYLFNDSRASLTWLINNDPMFLFQLVNSFGYDKEFSINELVLKLCYESYQYDNVRINFSSCDDLFIMKSCRYEVYVKSGILETIANLTTPTDYKYIEMLYTYLDAICSDQHATSLNREELTQLICCFGRLEIDLRKIYGSLWSPYAGISSLLDEDLLYIAAKKNYYGIPNFEEVLKIVEWESPYINDGDDSVMPFDYDDL